MKFLFILFVVLPIVEIMVLIEVGSQIGTLNTAALVVLTALIGSLMLRQQGLSTLFRARERIDSGQLPLQEMLEGICLAVGGALLVTPGFVTDAIGFACLLPVSRVALVRIVSRYVVAHADIVEVRATTMGGQQRQGDAIEGEFTHPDDDREN